MFNESDVILPQAYFYEDKHVPKLRQKHIYAKVYQAQQIAKKLNKQIPIYPYIKMEYITKWNDTAKTSFSDYYTKVL